ncbi:unnamed protein product [Amoebophrya sp. A120]|nr:unnamed protein product [Amoebophrya sp. A120]|eukprot:GSA120T00004667001.1
MFCCVRYGLEEDSKTFFNLNCGTAVLQDFIESKALKQIKLDITKQKEIHRKQISTLARQLNAHSKHLSILQKRNPNATGATVAGGGAPGDEETGAGDKKEEEQEEEEVDEYAAQDAKIEVLPKDNMETVTSWIEGTEGEIRDREAALVALDEAEIAFQDVEKVDLVDSATQEKVSFRELFPVHLPATACLPLRSTTDLIGLRGEGVDPLPLTFAVPKVVRSAEVEQMLLEGVLAGRR